MSAEINIQNASLRFRIYRDRTPNLKEAVIGALSRKKSIATAENVMEFDALRNINLSLRGGDRIGIIGLNGAGKSTLLKMIVGIYPPHEGRVHVVGRVTPLIELGTGFDSELSGRENIYLNGSLLGRSFKQTKALEQEIIEFSELNDFIDMPIKYYSSGMHGRLAFAIATIANPEILIMDEIFATGDAHFVHKATARLRDLFNHSHITMLVSHDMPRISEFCNRVIVLHKGEIVNDGNPDEMIRFYEREIAI